jgi:pimeloyl-ACP methyl ester carboxylesterase
VRLLLMVLTAVCVASSPALAQEYSYPYRDPYLATVTGAALNADGLTPGIKRQVVHVSILPNRDKLPKLEGKGELSVALYQQKRAAPLVFIVPGTGSTPYFGLATYFAKLFYQDGAHVVIMPSPMSWNFALAASRSGAPGYTPEDARDLYGAMQRTLDVLKAKNHLKVTRVNFMGMSLGALEGAYLSLLDGAEGRIGISRYLLVNPPLDVASVLKRLDEWDSLKEKFGAERSKEITGKALSIVEAFTNQKRDDLAAFDVLAKGFSTFTTEELQFLIAEYLQTVLPELVTVTQAIRDQQVLNAPPGEVRKRIEEAKGMTFTEYSDKIAVPVWRAQTGEADTTSDTFGARGSLDTIIEQLRGNPRIYIMHNSDDFLAGPKSIEQLKDVLGDHMILYPYGGHLGNLWFPQNRATVRRLLK